MNTNNFSIIIANDDIRERVFAEIWYKGDLWAEISQELEEPVVCFFPSKTSKYWEFSYKEALNILETAKNKLLEL